MKIGKLAQATDCSIQTIRFYEKEGLLTSQGRTEGNFRLYDQSSVRRLSFIKQCRTLGLSLAEIRQLIVLSDFPETGCGDVNKMIEDHVKAVERRIDELRSLHTQLKSLRDSCSEEQTVEQCGILSELRSS